MELQLSLQENTGKRLKSSVLIYVFKIILGNEQKNQGCCEINENVEVVEIKETISCCCKKC
ncbi:MAG: hypothetical protein ACR2F1_15440 [Nitrososphaeraceae archaeon]